MPLLLLFLTPFLMIQGFRNYGFWRTVLSALGGALVGGAILAAFTVGPGDAVPLLLVAVIPLGILIQLDLDRRPPRAKHRDASDPSLSPIYKEPYQPPYPDLVRRGRLQRQEPRLGRWR